MIESIMPIVIKVYFPVLMPFVLLLMSVLMSDHIIDAVKSSLGR